MKAIIFDEFGGPERLAICEMPTPTPAEGEIRIKVRAFGVNSAETHMRAGHWGDVARVTGIECVGEVDSDPSGTLRAGQTVAAICGGMGRWRDGSYAEYTCVPLANVFAIQTSLPWADFAAIPESYATAWTALFENLNVKNADVILVRGATSALGQAAVNIASHAGATVLATTRDQGRIALLKTLGAHHVLIDSGSLYEAVRNLYPEGIDGVVDIVGNSVLRDSLKMPKKGGTVCQVGFLGGGEPVEAFNPIMDLPSGVNFNFFASALVYGTDGYPLSAIPMQQIVERLADGTYKTRPSRVFQFEEIVQAHELMESGRANGKIVVTLPS